MPYEYSSASAVEDKTDSVSCFIQNCENEAKYFPRSVYDMETTLK